jgi:hypothetical protein
MTDPIVKTECPQQHRLIDVQLPDLFFDILGWAGSLLLVISILQTKIDRLRWLNFAACAVTDRLQHLASVLAHGRDEYSDGSDQPVHTYPAPKEARRRSYCAAAEHLSPGTSTRGRASSYR